ncbi:MAG: endolytic transglycosylase MltG, partial [Treponema sp.]|nr:endolytic transglycosylase MltG [Treponema sp.]
LDAPPEVIPPEGVLFTVGAGEPGARIAVRLEEEGLIRSALAFQVLLRLRNQQSLLKKGTYRIEPGMRSRDVQELLVSGKQALVRVTVPEGHTLRRTADVLHEAGVVDREEFLAAARDPALVSSLGIPAATAEGYLFPDTYYIPLKTPGEEAVRLMVGALRSRLAEGLPESLALDPQELHLRIILASIVEREYRLTEEAPRIAGVFWNRLKIGMALQSCATVVYIITEVQGKKHPEVLYNRDIEIRHPFNTYLHPGLPPAPIANPGLTALRAVFRPEPSRYLYFRLLDARTGRHYFSETLDEHIRAGALAVKGIGGR